MLRSWIPKAGRCKESFEQGVVCSEAGSRKITLGVGGRCWSLGASLGSVDKGCPSNEVLIANWSVTLWNALGPKTPGLAMLI